MLKNKKSQPKKSKFKLNLYAVVFTLLIFTTYSIFALLKSGSGPLSFLSHTSDINKVSTNKPCVRDPACADLLIQAAENGMRFANTERITTQQAASSVQRVAEKLPKPKDPKKAQEVEDIISESSRIVNLTTTASPIGQGAAGGQPPVQPGAAAPVASVLQPVAPVTLKKDSCAIGNGVKVAPGSFVATGAGLDDKGQRCTSGGCSKRECVEILDGCGHGRVVACDVQYAINPSSVVLPVSAGSEYIIGMTDAEVKAEQVKDKNFKKPEIDKNCYDKGGTIRTTGTQLDDQRCVDGSWQKDASTIACPAYKIYYPLTNTCVDKPGPTKEEIEAAEKATKAAAEKAAKEEADKLKAEKDRITKPYADKGCGSALKSNEQCVQIQGSTQYGIVTKDFAGAISYNSGATAGRPSSLTNNIYNDENTCKLALKGGEVCQVSSSGSFGSTGNGYTIVADKSAANTKDRAKYVEYTFGSTTAGNNSQNSVSPQDVEARNVGASFSFGSPEPIDDNSSDKIYKPGERCGGSDNSIMFGQLPLTNTCQRKCEGGVFTTIKTGTLGLNKILVCGETNDTSVLTTLNVISLDESNAQIVKDNSAELTSKLLSECSNDFGSKNLCNRCEGGVVTTLDYGDSQKRYCGTQDQIKNESSIVLPSADIVNSVSDNSQTANNQGANSISISQIVSELPPQTATIAKGSLAGASICAGTLAVAGFWTASAAWYFIPACTLIGAGTGAAVSEYVNSEPKTELAPAATSLTSSEKETAQHIENLQTKYEIIIKKDPQAFDYELNASEKYCERFGDECVGIGDGSGRWIQTHLILDKARELSVELP